MIIEGKVVTDKTLLENKSIHIIWNQNNDKNFVRHFYTKVNFELSNWKQKYESLSV